jgi:hypothetical protein
MPNRVIKSRAPGGTTQLADMLASLLALELMAPSGRLYLISPRLGDMAVISSPFGQFRALMPEIGRTELRLSDALGALAARGSTVRVLYRPGDVHTDAFIARLAPDVERRGLARLDERGLVSERFYLRGSLEFDLGGVGAGDESVEMSTDPSDVSRALLEAEQLWGRAS